MLLFFASFFVTLSPASVALAAQGRPVDVSGYYLPDDAMAEKAMRPSPTFNAIIDGMIQVCAKAGVTPAEIGQIIHALRVAVTGKDADRFSFKVPTLRNVELTYPYFHDGEAETDRSFDLLGDG